MPDQETPSNHPLTLRVTQELYRRLELLADRRGYPDVTALVRALLIDHAGAIPLDEEDYAEIGRRVAARKEALDARRARRR